MAREITARVYVRMRKGNFFYNPPQQTYTADLTSDGKGPTPGSITVTYDGTLIDLSELTDPGYLHMVNQEPTEGTTVSWGVYDPQTNRYYPIGVLRPGKPVFFELDELFGSEFYPVTGTGTGISSNSLMIKAKDGDSATVFVGAFER